MSQQPENGQHTDETVAMGTNSPANKTVAQSSSEQTVVMNESGGTSFIGDSEVSHADETVVGGAVPESGIHEAQTISATVVGGGGAKTKQVGQATQVMSQSSDALPIGGMYQDKYEIVKLLGAGGMGRVYQALHVDLDSMVAIKVMSAALNQDREAVERFQREARAMAKITHPNAVRVIDYGVKDGQCFLVMEFLEGESLRDRLNRRKRMSPGEVVHFAEQVCYVLEFMHRKGITHRDLKPDNIFFHRQEGMETIKVLDFGIAKTHQTATQAGSDLTADGMMIGTPRYMSPEQCQGTKVDGRSDLYSFAVVLYEMLSGQVPFDGDNPFTIALKHINTPLPPLESVAPDLPPQLCEAINKGLSKDPNARYQSAKELSEALCQAAAVNPTVRMDMLEGLRQVDFNADTGETRDPATGNTRRAGVETGPMRPGTVRLSGGSPWLKYGVVAAVVIAILAGSAVVYNNLQEAKRRATEEEDRKRQQAEINRQANNPLKNFELIEGGTFKMGRDPGADKYTQNQLVPTDETPAHDATVGTFYLAKNEVTNAEYSDFVTNAKYQPPKTWKNGSFEPGTERYPVTDISWDDARAYCEWLTKEKGGNGGIEFRLPTEAEWEFAAGGARGQLFPWSSLWNETNANCGKGDDSGSPLPVDAVTNQSDKSPFGIFALAGNVSEWTATDFKPYPGSAYKPTENDLKCKIFRGGSYAQVRAYARITSRQWALKDFTARFVGFRVAATKK